MEFKNKGIRAPHLHILSVPPSEERESSDSVRNVRFRTNRKESEFDMDQGNSDL